MKIHIYQFRPLLILAACFSGLLSTASSGAQEQINILLDPGSNAREYRQMGTRMERDLKNVLEKRGHYQAPILRTRDEFKQGKGDYLLTVKIVRYNAGSKAARIVVGFGAGTCSMDIHYELIGPQGNTLLSKDDGCASGLDWQRLARKLNENILAAIQTRLSAGNLDADVAPKITDTAATPVPVIAPQMIQPEPVAPPPPSRPQPVATAPAPAAIQSPPPTPQPAIATPDPVEQLRQLDTMKKQRLISEGEYKQKRKQILDRL